MSLVKGIIRDDLNSFNRKIVFQNYKSKYEKEGVLPSKVSSIGPWFRALDKQKINKKPSGKSFPIFKVDFLKLYHHYLTNDLLPICAAYNVLLCICYSFSHLTCLLSVT